MSTRIFKLYLIKPTLEAINLPQERFNDYMAKNDHYKKDLGVRDLLFGRVWSDENITHFGVEMYPDWKAVREHNRCMEEIHFYQYLHSEIFLGVDSERDGPNTLEPIDASLAAEGIALIWQGGNLDPMYSITEEEMAAGMKVFDLEKTLGTRTLLSAYSRPIDERWDGWGVAVYRSMEAILEKAKLQEQVKWWKFIKARTLLGTIESGELVKAGS